MFVHEPSIIIISSWLTRKHRQVGHYGLVQWPMSRQKLDELSFPQWLAQTMLLNMITYSSEEEEVLKLVSAAAKLNLEGMKEQSCRNMRKNGCQAMKHSRAGIYAFYVHYSVLCNNLMTTTRPVSQPIHLPHSVCVNDNIWSQIFWKHCLLSKRHPLYLSFRTSPSKTLGLPPKRLKWSPSSPPSMHGAGTVASTCLNTFPDIYQCRYLNLCDCHSHCHRHSLQCMSLSGEPCLQASCCLARPTRNVNANV